MRAARNALQIGMMLASRHGSLAKSKEAKPRERRQPPLRPGLMSSMFCQLGGSIKATLYLDSTRLSSRSPSSS